MQKENQAPLFVDSAVEGTLPPISILDPAEKKQLNYSPESLAAVGHLLEIKLKEKLDGLRKLRTDARRTKK